MTFKEQIKAIIDGVRPQFDTLGLYMFQGAGEPENVSKSFVSIFEAYQKAKELTRQTFGTDGIELQEGSMWCSPIGGIVDTDDSEMQAAYEIAKEQGVLPPQLFDQMFDFGMQMNRFFIAAQQQ